MKKIFLLIAIPYLMFADTWLLYSEKVNDRGVYIWTITACKDDYIYRIVKQEPVDMKNIEKEFDLIKHVDKRFPCPTDFKHPSQFPKD